MAFKGVSVLRKVDRLKKRLLRSQEKVKKYSEIRDTDYDNKLEYEKNKLISEELPKIINYIETGNKEIEKALEDRKYIDKEKEEKTKLEIKKYKKDEKVRFKKERKRLRENRRKGLISKKAEGNEKRALKQKYKENIKVKSYDLESKANREFVRNKKYEIKKNTRDKLKILNSNIADINNNTPIEVKKRKPIIAYLTFLFPGLGQILNKEYEKGIIFSLASIFTYFIAIPYALGYGNYQGEGIKGLITLAEGGKRVDKSLIFMIEGILSVFLILISLLLIYISFRDVLKIEKAIIKGKRPRMWSEIKDSIGRGGFPYVTTMPAYILIIFMVLLPAMTTVLLSLTNMDPNHQSKFNWAGFQNYKAIFLGDGLAGSVFWLSLLWTLIWTIFATTLAIVIGFGLALLVNQERIKGKNIFRTIYLLPWAVPAFITIMFFSIMLSPNGAISELVNQIFGTSISVKTNTIQTRIALILLQGWLGSSYVFLLFTGVLQAIPGELYEAAGIDGASTWQKLRKITIPMVLNQTAPLLIGQYVFNFNNFSIIFLFNSGGPFAPTKYGNLAGSSDLLISYIYKLTIENQYQGIGAAITVFISLIVMFISYLGYRNTKAFKEEM